MNTKPRHIERPRLTSWTTGAMAALCFWATGCMYNTQDAPGAIEVDLDSSTELHDPESVDSLLGDHAQLQYTSGDPCGLAVSTYLASLEAYLAAVIGLRPIVRFLLETARERFSKEELWFLENDHEADGLTDAERQARWDRLRALGEAIRNLERVAGDIPDNLTRLEEIIISVRTRILFHLDPDSELLGESYQLIMRLQRAVEALPLAISQVLEALRPIDPLTGITFTLDGRYARLHAQAVADYNEMADICGLPSSGRREYPASFCDPAPGRDGIPLIHAEYESSTAPNRAEVALRAAGWEEYAEWGIEGVCGDAFRIIDACERYIAEHDIPRWTNPMCLERCAQRWFPVALECFEQRHSHLLEGADPVSEPIPDPSPGPSSDPTPDSPPAEPDSSPGSSEAGFGYEE